MGVCASVACARVGAGVSAGVGVGVARAWSGRRAESHRAVGVRGCACCGGCVAVAVGVAGGGGAVAGCGCIPFTPVHNV